MRAWPAAGVVIVTLSALGAPASAETVKMKAALAAPSGTTSQGRGNIDATYDTSTRMLTWTGSYSGLSGPATMAHFHGPADPGKNAPVLIPSPAETPIKGSATLNDQQAAALTAGKTYFNIHTAANPGGEIRGQVEK